MSHATPTALPEIVRLLSSAQELADQADETLLGAKIDEALECAHDALATAG